MSKFRNTEYYECAPVSPNEKWEHGNSSMQRKVGLFYGSLKNRIQAALDFIGYQTVINSPNTKIGNYIHRVIPMNYPGLSGFNLAPEDVALNVFNVDSGASPISIPSISNKFFVEAISRTEPVGKPTGLDLLANPPNLAGSNYERVNLTLECMTYPYAIIDDNTLMDQGGVYYNRPDEGAALALGWQFTRYITRQRDAFSRVLTIPYGVMQTNVRAKGIPGVLGVVGKLNKTGIPFREGGENRRYTWMRVPLTPAIGANFGYIEGSLGLVNNAPFDGCMTETLLLDSISTKEYQGAFGEWLADITFNMIFLPHNSSGARLNLWRNTGRNQPFAPDGTTPLDKGVPSGWNTIIDVDYDGNWDYYEATTAKYVDDVLVPGQKPFQSTDFAALFRPPQ